jgi:small subunit ribosomal protein S16
MVRISLTRVGRTHTPAYRVVVMPKTAARDSKVIEQIGTYSPLTKEVKIDKERAEYWLSVGAQPSETVDRLLVNEKIKKASKFKRKFNKKPGRKKQERAEKEAAE